MAGNGKIPRRQERIFAFKVLYGLCFCPASDEQELESFFLKSPDKPESKEIAAGFGWKLVLGVWGKQQELDSIISSFSQNWRVDRIGKVELTLLRIAMFELIYCMDVPPKVVLNEAIELSKLFGDEKSRTYVNGVLDSAASALEQGKLQRKAAAPTTRT